MNGRKRIDEFWVVIATDADGTEGVPALAGPLGEPLALYTSEPRLVGFMRVAAERVAANGLKAELVKFSTRETVAVFHPPHG